jgi:hypothetical protein
MTNVECRMSNGKSRQPKVAESQERRRRGGIMDSFLPAFLMKNFETPNRVSSPTLLFELR